MYRFNQAVNTPNGPASFIAPVWEIEKDPDTGEEKIVHLGVQVSRLARFDELSRDEIELVKPVVKEWDRETFTAWLKKATYCKNEIYPLEQVTG